MYIDIVPNRNSPPAILLRESIREGQKIKKHTIANLSKWKSVRIEALRCLLRGDFDGVTSAETVSGKIFGTLFVLKEFSNRLGITKALGNTKYSKLALFLILARIANQGSRLAAIRWAKNHAVAEVLGLEDFDEDDLYKTLDWIAEKQDKIEDKSFKEYLKKRAVPLSLVLYDVTSSYFEGEKNELAAFGHNRDKKGGKKQIVIGLLTATDGEPLSVKVFKGNTSDPATIEEQIETTKNRFGIREVVFVGDRGMVKAKGRTLLSNNGFKYISALTNPEIRKLLKKEVIQLGLFDETLHEVECEGERLILRCNPHEKRKEEYRREDKIKRLEDYVKKRNLFVANSQKAKPDSGLKKYLEWVKKHKISSFVNLFLKEREIIIEIDLEAKADNALLDGCYVLRSNASKEMLTQDIHDRYMDLQNVERDFRTMKTQFLEIRPIFVRKAGRTKGHVFITMLALKIVREMRKLLKEEFGTINSDKGAINLEEVLEALSRLNFTHTKLGNHTLTQIPNPDLYQTQILNSLQIRWPATKKFAKKM